MDINILKVQHHYQLLFLVSIIYVMPSFFPEGACCLMKRVNYGILWLLTLYNPH